MAYAFDDFLPLLRKLNSVQDPRAVRRYLCALVAALAYRHVPSAEIDRNRRAQVIPCADYRRIVATGMPATISEEYLGRLDGVQFFAIADRGVVAVGLLVDRTLFIGFRGTKYLYDWNVNFRASMHVGLGGRMHRGFLEETVRIIPPLIRKITEVCGNGDPFVHLHVAGHSLGGAVAAIAATLLPYPTESLCTFGAPRYGDACVQLQTWARVGQEEALSPPVEHVQASGDIVPFVPPRWMGYADNPNDVTTCGRPVGLVGRRSTWLHTVGQAGIFFAKLAVPHSIQRYRHEVGRRVEAPCFAAPLIPDI